MLDSDLYTEQLLLFIEIVFPSDTRVPLQPGTSYFQLHFQHRLQAHLLKSKVSEAGLKRLIELYTLYLTLVVFGGQAGFDNLILPYANLVALADRARI